MSEIIVKTKQNKINLGTSKQNTYRYWKL